MSHSDQLNLLQDFNANSGVVKSKKKKSKTTSISVRVTEEEKAALQAMAGTMALAHFIRERALGDEVETRAKRYQVKPRQPSLDSTELARLLGMFGQSELATSILALSLAATQGNLDVTPALEEKIECACDEIHTIKLALILALGVKPQGEHT
ncbi:MAG: hypothetical protein MK137_01575 [Rickettsiales bacterium]|nr:hypothetical protein [Rickettsiales bacterium]